MRKSFVRKPISILLSLLVLLSVCAAAASARGGEPNWVPIKTSADALTTGDLYIDLASIKETYVDRLLYQSLCDYVSPKDPNWSPSDPPRFNNLSVVACEKLATLYPELWEAALQEAYNADPRWAIDSFYTIQDAWSILFGMVKDEHPELGFTNWSDLSSYGYAYILEEYPEAYAQAAADAAAEFAAYETAAWSYDSNFTSSWSWLKAENDGEELLYIPEEIKGTLSEYGANWVAVKAATDDLTHGDYYLDEDALHDAAVAFVTAKYADYPDDAQISVGYDFQTGEEIYKTKQELMDEALQNALAIIPPISVNTNAAEGSLFKYKVTDLYVMPKEQFDQMLEYYPPEALPQDYVIDGDQVIITRGEGYLPIAELRSGNESFPSAAALDACVKSIPADHDYTDVEWTYADADRHVRYCTICGEADYEGHDVIVRGAGDATCVDEGYTGDEFCSVCGERLSVGEIIPPTGEHTTVLVNAKDATATEDGYTGDEVCTFCGLRVRTGEVIPATGEVTPDEPGNGACPLCGRTHTAKWVRIVHYIFFILVSVFKK